MNNQEVTVLVSLPLLFQSILKIRVSLTIIYFIAKKLRSWPPEWRAGGHLSSGVCMEPQNPQEG